MIRKALCALLAIGLAATGLVANNASAAPTQTAPPPPRVGNKLDKAFRMDRRGDFNIERLKPVVRPLLTHKYSYMQSFAIVGNRIIVAGTIPGTSNVALTMFNMRGKKLGWMFFKNVGHAISIAATPYQGSIVVWMEADSDRRDGDGRGTTLARFPFRSGKKLATRQLSKFRPAPGSNNLSTAIDYATRTLAVRYRVNGRTYFDRYNLKQAILGRYIKVSSAIAPLPCSEKESGVIQGWAVSGDYIYCYQGPTGGPAFASWRNLATDDYRQFRIKGITRQTEPEGLTVTPLWGQQRLVMGLVSGKRRVVRLLSSS